jgi:hypothetical protein
VIQVSREDDLAADPAPAVTEQPDAVVVAGRSADHPDGFGWMRRFSG